MNCLCGEFDCDYMAFDYPWCRSCLEHHRAPECAIDESGQALAPCGHPWFSCTAEDHETAVTHSDPHDLTA